MEQFSPIYHTSPANINTPGQSNLIRLFRSTVDNLYYIKKSDGTFELFSTGILPVPAITLVSALFQDLDTVGNIGAGQDTIYSNDIAAGKFAVNGDEVKAQYSINIADTLNAKTIRLSFGGTNIFTSTNDYSTGTAFPLDFNASIIRVNANTIKTIVSYFSNGITETQTNTITPVNFAIANTLLLTGEGVADNDIVGNFVKGIFIPFAV